MLTNQIKILSRPRALRQALTVALREKSALAASSSAASESWSTGLSFASPESDFTAAPFSTTAATENNNGYKVNFSSAHNRQAEWSNTLSFASPESDFTTPSPTRPALEPVTLPHTLKEAMQHAKYNDQAIVITTAARPHKIVYVNHAWEEMCGYRQEEVVHQPIGTILQGPKTNVEVARSMTKQLLESMSSQVQQQKDSFDAYLVNYKASGEPFLNHITAGLLYTDDAEESLHNKKRQQGDDESVEKPHFLVGILQEVTPDQVPLRLAV
mmetsp:Transcript_35295/g.73480  ORF Transcript_35295/g.73480 Transcript_35295/m.73480 type:complete len:270 (-) Transcript_35295:499-1308(-)